MTMQGDLASIARELAGAVDRITPAARDVPAVRAGIPMAMYRDRLISLERLRSELRALGYTGQEAARLEYAAVLDRERAHDDLIRDAAVKLYERDLINITTLQGILRSLGIGDTELQEEIILSDFRRALRLETPPPDAEPFIP